MHIGETLFGQMSPNLKYLVQNIVFSYADLQGKRIKNNVYYQPQNMEVVLSLFEDVFVEKIYKRNL